MSKFVKFRLAFEPVMVDKANDIELQYSKIGFDKSGVRQDNIEVLFLDVGKEQVIQNVELFFLFQGFGKEFDEVKHKNCRS
jgi:hypothetical protein